MPTKRCSVKRDRDAKNERVKLPALEKRSLRTTLITWVKAEMTQKQQQQTTGNFRGKVWN